MRRYIGGGLVGLCLALAACAGCGPGASTKSNPPALTESVAPPKPEPEAKESTPVAADTSKPDQGPKLMVAENTPGKLPAKEPKMSAKAPAKTPKYLAGVKLISRDILFGNPEKAAARLSHDGKQLAFLARVNDVLNVWVGPA